MIKIIIVGLITNVLTHRTCDTENYNLHYGNIKNNNRLQKASKLYLKNNYKLNDKKITIPIIWNILYNVNIENISDEQIQSQLDILNKDFSSTNTDINNTPGEFQPIIGNMNIDFYTDKIIRKQTSVTSFGTNNNIKFNSTGGLDATTPLTKLNIWVGNIGNGILGYAQFPGGDKNTDGVVVSPNYIGNTGYVSPPYNQGRTLTHEIGHWLNLFHIWYQNGCEGDDFVIDTPLSDSPNYGCPSYPDSSCGTSDMFMNYMDYVDDACMVMFSKGQVIRSRTLFDIGGGGFRLSFLYPNCIVDNYHWLGDGFCDKENNYNTEECGWDFGDCCSNCCEDGINSCSTNNNDYDCKNPSCVIPGFLGSNSTNLPTLKPTKTPTLNPTTKPTNTPTLNPTLKPTKTPTLIPSKTPTLKPTNTPSLNPTLNPTKTPTLIPSKTPTLNPTKTPTLKPTSSTLQPTYKPTINPTKSTLTPTLKPTSSTLNPTKTPTINPTKTQESNTNIFKISYKLLFFILLFI